MVWRGCGFFLLLCLLVRVESSRHLDEEGFVQFLQIFEGGEQAKFGKQTSTDKKHCGVSLAKVDFGAPAVVSMTFSVKALVTNTRLWSATSGTPSEGDSVRLGPGGSLEYWNGHKWQDIAPTGTIQAGQAHTVLFHFSGKNQLTAEVDGKKQAPIQEAPYRLNTFKHWAAGAPLDREHGECFQGTIQSVEVKQEEETSTEDDSQPGAVEPTIQRVQGRIKLHGRYYRTLCTCLNSMTSTNCKAPVRVRVHQQRFNSHRGLSKEQLRDLLGAPQDFVMTSVETHSFSCVDGRESNSVLGTPGGDFGEFLIALNVYDNLVEGDFEAAKIKELLTNYLGMVTTPMYYHTDDTAIANLRKNVKRGSERGVISLQLDRPQDDLKVPILNDIALPDNQGCDFIKAILTSPDKYFMRKSLVEDAIKALHQILWDKKANGADGAPLSQKVNFVVLNDNGKPRKKEQAWVNFRANEHCEQEHKAPLFVPDSGSGNPSVLVNHPQAANFARMKLARWIATQSPQVDRPVSEIALLISRRAQHNTEVFAEMAGAEVPFYTATVE